MATLVQLSAEERRYFLRRLREARYAALDDAENFTGICFALEELGKRIEGCKKIGLGKYQPALRSLVDAQTVTAFAGNLKRLVHVRNDRSHQGVYARNAVAKAVAVCAALEDCFMTHADTVEDIMVEGVTYAQPFMPLAKVRELMLAHSFSYLPVTIGETTCLLSDHEVARCWRSMGNHAPDRHITPIATLVSNGTLTVIPAQPLPAATPLADLPIPHEPRLVTDAQGNVVGIVSAFDWL